ncbi:general substrate transporter [Microthyrium microscopicum]|uniref:General substrate transporter n=1 Tax=Microthyrium microscopicum TaxID=703497 RepID=A0A6A6UU03_9PEZI|nr:general substrate transporter [Microthyrium microscopicum]
MAKSKTAKSNKTWFGMTGARLTFWVTVACATDMTLFGYDQGKSTLLQKSGVVVTKDYLNTFGLRNNPSLLGTITAIYDIGCFFGAILAFVVGDRLGRKKTILLGTTVMSVGAILQIVSWSVPQLIVGRIVAGIGNGLNTATAPVWQSETSKTSWRGKLVVIEMVFNIFGFCLSNWVTFGFSFVDSPVSWRVPLAFQFLFIFILFATVPWLPESPRWLVSHGRISEAEEILADLEDTGIDDPYIITQSREIQWAANYEREHAVRWRDLLRGRTGDAAGTSTLRRMILGMGTQAMQQLSGINVTSYYLPTVLIESVGQTETMARLLAACNSVSYLLFSLIGIPNVERWGRRKMMMYAALGQGICYLMITILIGLNETEGFDYQKQAAEASIAFFFLYYVFFGIGWQGVPWLYPTEINSLSMRTKGAAAGTATNWMFNFIVVEITPIGIASLKWRFYIIWTLMNLAFVPIVYIFYPETADRSLEDVDRFFSENQNVLVFRDKEAISGRRPARYLEREVEEYRQHSANNSRRNSVGTIRVEELHWAPLMGRMAIENNTRMTQQWPNLYHYLLYTSDLVE